jgi:hypothetical protein
MNDRQNLTSFHLTVRLCVVSRQMHAIRRSLKCYIKVSIRLRVARFVLFIARICSGND